MATLGEYLRDRFRESINWGLGDAAGTLTNVARAGGQAVNVNVWPSTSPLSTMIEAVLTTAGGLLGGSLAAGYGALRAVESAGGPVGLGVGAGYLLGYLIGPALEPLLAPVKHAFGDALQTEIFDPETAARLETKGLLDHAAGRSEAAGGNLAGEHYDKLVQDAIRRPELAQLLQLWNFGQLTDADLDRELTIAGYEPAMQSRLKEFHRELLTGADLALAQLRGEIDQATLDGYAKQLGITPQDMTVLIANTGEPPGPEQLMEALRRGFIDRARFERGIRQSRVRDEWIDVERNLAHAPMSVSEAVRAVVENYISEATGGQIAEQNGLLPAHWPILVEAFGRPLAHEQMLTLYHRGQASRRQVDQAVRESDIKNKYIDQSFELGRHLIPERQIVQMLSHGTISPTLAARKLLEQGYDDADVKLIIQLGTAEHTSTTKELTKADVLGLLHDQLITKANAHARLTKLGYSGDTASQLIALEEAKRHGAQLRQIQSQVKSSLLAHRLDAEQAIGRLVAGGVDREQATSLVSQWTRDRGHPTRELSEAQIIAAATHQVIAPLDALNRLQHLGLAAGDAVILLVTHGFTRAQLNAD